MASEKRLIDANALDEKLEILKVRYKAQGRDSVAEDYNFVQTVLLTAPTVDAVEVVRCKDCKKWEATNTMRCDGYCHNPKFHLHYGKVIERCFMPLTKQTDFCSYGERKEHG